MSEKDILLRLQSKVLRIIFDCKRSGDAWPGYITITKLIVYRTYIMMLLKNYVQSISGVTLPFGAPCSFFAAPTNFLLSPKKKKKKKVATFFSVFPIGFLPPGAFCTPKYFFASTER